MTSSSWHGVTTVLIGNCGVTFAPVVAADREFLAEMMESVEDVPRDAILEGMPWDWETYPEYLDSVQRMRPAVNIVGMVGHCAVRYNVMGERSLGDQPATPAELARMSDIAAESVAGGAVGFSTSRILLHTIPDGRYVPGTLAPLDEYLAIADGMNAAGGGLFQSVNDFPNKPADEITLLREMARSCGDVLFSGGPGNGVGTAGVEMFGKFLADTNANVGRITLATQTRQSGTLCGLAQVAPVKGKQWKALMALPTLARPSPLRRRWPRQSSRSRRTSARRRPPKERPRARRTAPIPTTSMSRRTSSTTARCRRPSRRRSPSKARSASTTRSACTSRRWARFRCSRAKRRSVSRRRSRPRA
jgi:hypothetical protein